jgi:O-antigen ligase
MASLTQTPDMPASADWVMSRGFPVLVALAAACAAFIPRFLPVIFAGLALIVIVAAWLARGDATRDEAIRPHGDGERDGDGDRDRDRVGAWAFGFVRRVWREQPATLAFLAFATYAGVTALWSPAPASAVSKISWLVLLILTVSLAIRHARTASTDMLHRAAWGVAIALVLASIFVLLEVVRHQAIARFLYNNVPYLNPGPNKHMTFENGSLRAIGSWVMNRHIGALNLILWPGLMCLLAVWRDWRGRAAAALIVLAVLVASMASVHESSQIAIVVAAVVFLVAKIHLPAGRSLVLAGWLVAVLAMLPVVVLAHKAGLQTYKKIPDSGQARIILWNFTAHKYTERPIFGVGASATKSIDEEVKPAGPLPPGQVYGERTGQHSHNVFLQTWFELGAVGALALLACGLLLWQSIARMPALAQPFALAGATSAMCIGALTWGFWQEWYLSLFALAVLLAGLGSAALSRASDETNHAAAEMS